MEEAHWLAKQPREFRILGVTGLRGIKVFKDDLAECLGVKRRTLYRRLDEFRCARGSLSTLLEPFRLDSDSVLFKTFELFEKSVVPACALEVAIVLDLLFKKEGDIEPRECARLRSECIRGRDGSLRYTNRIFRQVLDSFATPRHLQCALWFVAKHPDEYAKSRFFQTWISRAFTRPAGFEMSQSQINTLKPAVGRAARSILSKQRENLDWHALSCLGLLTRVCGFGDGKKLLDEYYRMCTSESSSERMGDNLSTWYDSYYEHQLWLERRLKYPDEGMYSKAPEYAEAEARVLESLKKT